MFSKTIFSCLVAANSRRVSRFQQPYPQGIERGCSGRMAHAAGLEQEEPQHLLFSVEKDQQTYILGLLAAILQPEKVQP